MKWCRYMYLYLLAFIKPSNSLMQGPWTCVAVSDCSCFTCLACRKLNKICTVPAVTWPRRISLIRLMKWPWWSRKLATLQHIWFWYGIYLMKNLYRLKSYKSIYTCIYKVKNLLKINMCAPICSKYESTLLHHILMGHGYFNAQSLSHNRYRVTHICVSNLIFIGSDNGLSPGRRQAIIWTNAGSVWLWIFSRTAIRAIPIWRSIARLNFVVAIYFNDTKNWEVSIAMWATRFQDPIAQRNFS